MCIIIDANCLALFYGASPPSRYSPIWDWLKRDGKVVCGGKLLNEYAKVVIAIRQLYILKAAGKARIFDKEKIEAENELLKEFPLKSNDHHIIALARVSKARVLVSNDRRLWVDFKNKKYIDGPRGSVYTKAEHRKLLKHHGGCR